MDFWRSLTSQMPRDLDYETLYEQFAWDLPTHYNMGIDACDRHAADKGRLALICDRGNGTVEKWTFWELKQASNRFANALRSLGVEKGDRVAVLLSQSAELPVAHIALYKLGAIGVPLFVLFGEDALRFRLEDSGAKVIVTDQEHSEIAMTLSEELPELQHVVLTDDEGTEALSFDSLIQDSSATFEPVMTRPEDPAVLIYTSGTTGSPKGALHGHQILPGHLPGVSLPHDLAPRRGDLFWTPADWAWIGGLFDVLFPALHWGVPVVAYRMTRFDPEEAFEVMERWGVQNTFLPPTALKMMGTLSQPRERWALELQTIGCGGEPLGEEVFNWAQEELGISINEFYGQTECNLVLSNCNALMPPKPGSMGRAVPGHRVAVIDEEGNPLDPGETGEVAIKRPDPVMMLGYWNNEEATEDKFVGNWLKTGDLATCDEDGYFHFVSRDDDVISSAGYRIGPVEIEDTLAGHEAVLMAAAIGKPDPTRGEMVKAFVVLQEESDSSEDLTAELQDLVKKRLGAHEYPREIEFVDELPMTSTGKIQRNILRQQETPEEENSEG